MEVLQLRAWSGCGQEWIRIESVLSQDCIWLTPAAAVVLQRVEHVLAVLQEHFQFLNPLPALACAHGLKRPCPPLHWEDCFKTGLLAVRELIARTSDFWPLTSDF